MKTDKFHPGLRWADDRGVHINAHGGGILWHDGRYYWFGEHKVEGEAGNLAQVGVHCYSSSDLYHWKDEGVALHVSREPGSEIIKGCVIERPKVIYNELTRMFVMWFHLELAGQGYAAARSGIAVSEQPSGPYRYVKSLRPNAGYWPTNVTAEQQRPVDMEQFRDRRYSGADEGGVNPLNFLGRDFAGGQMARDMTLFVDDDSAAYHVYASEENSTLHVSQLSDDYQSSIGKYARVFPHRFMEAPAICKRSGRYYLIASGCTGWSPNAARSAVADCIFGPWTELGNPCIGPQAEITFGGQSTFILPVPGTRETDGKPDNFIAMFDRWRPENAIDGRHVWLPVDFEEGRITVRWRDEWDLSYFEK